MSQAEREEEGEEEEEEEEEEEGRERERVGAIMGREGAKSAPADPWDRRRLNTSRRIPGGGFSAFAGFMPAVFPLIIMFVIFAEVSFLTLVTPRMEPASEDILPGGGKLFICIITV